MAGKRKQAQEQTAQEMEELRVQLAEAQETLRAIREGEVDAVIVSGSMGEQVFSLVGADSIYRLIVETMKEAAFTVTFDGKILFCNAQFSEFVKRPMEQILGRSLREFVDPANPSTANAVLMVAQNQPVKQRLIFADAEGGLMPAHISANVLNQPDGLSICVVATDLTELENSTEMIQQLRRQQEVLQAANKKLAATEEELKVQNEELLISRMELDRSRARYQDLFETAPDGYISTDAQGTIQEANQAATRMFGCLADLEGKPFSALLPLSERETCLNLLARMTAGEKQPPNWELELRSHEGPQFWAAISVAAARNEEGVVIGLRWLIRDVTERKRAEKAMRQAEAEARARAADLAAIMDAIPAITLVAHDPQCSLMTGSRAAYELLQLPTSANPSFSAPADQRPRDFLPMKDGRKLRPEDLPIQRAAATGETIRDCELTLEFDNGRQVTLYGNAVPLLDESGKPRGAVGSFVDISELKQAEEEKLRHSTILEGINNVLSAALTCETEEALGAACLEVAEQLTQSRFGFIGEINEKGFEDIAISNPGWDVCKVLIADGHCIQPGNFKIHGIYGRVLSDGKGFFTNDPARHPDSIGLPQGHPPLESFLGVPLIRKDCTVGLIAVGNRPGGYSMVDQQALEALAPAVEEAFTRKRQEEELRLAKDELEQRVTERTAELALRANQLRALVGELTLTEKRERNRLARVLHDHIQQLLVAAKLRVALLVRGGDDAVRQSAKETEALLDECITASRSLTTELSPAVLHESGLNAGLEWLASWMTEKQGLSVHLEMQEIKSLPEDTKILLFESVRELLFNAVKHSRTSSAKVSLRSAGDFLQLVVSDQGVGFDPNTKLNAGELDGGFGLVSIRERLELMGGRFEIESVPGKGSRFVLSVPIAFSQSKSPELN